MLSLCTKNCKTMKDKSAYVKTHYMRYNNKLKVESE